MVLCRHLHRSMFIASRNWDLIPERSMSMVVPLLLDILWVLQVMLRCSVRNLTYFCLIIFLLNGRGNAKIFRDTCNWNLYISVTCFTCVYFILRWGQAILHFQIDRLILFIYHEPNADFVGEFTCCHFRCTLCCNFVEWDETRWQGLSLWCNLNVHRWFLLPASLHLTHNSKKLNIWEKVKIEVKISFVTNACHSKAGR